MNIKTLWKLIGLFAVQYIKNPLIFCLTKLNFTFSSKVQQNLVFMFSSFKRMCVLTQIILFSDRNKPAQKRDVRQLLVNNQLIVCSSLSVVSHNRWQQWRGYRVTVLSVCMAWFIAERFFLITLPIRKNSISRKSTRNCYFYLKKKLLPFKYLHSIFASVLV